MLRHSATGSVRKLSWVGRVAARAPWHTSSWSLAFAAAADQRVEAVNLRANDQCALTTGDNRWKAGLDVVVEGRAE